MADEDDVPIRDSSRGADQCRSLIELMWWSSLRKPRVVVLTVPVAQIDSTDVEQFVLDF